TLVKEVGGDGAVSSCESKHPGRVVERDRSARSGEGAVGLAVEARAAPPGLPADVRRPKKRVENDTDAVAGRPVDEREVDASVEVAGKLAEGADVAAEAAKRRAGSAAPQERELEGARLLGHGPSRAEAERIPDRAVDLVASEVVGDGHWFGRRLGGPSWSQRRGDGPGLG